MAFKTYDGENIDLPIHNHKMEDTKRNGETAYATSKDVGFAKKEDIDKIDNLTRKIDSLDDKIKDMKFNNTPK